MDFNDLKVNLGVFHHAESIYDTFKAIGSSFNPLPVENSHHKQPSNIDDDSLDDEDDE